MIHFSARERKERRKERRITCSDERDVCGGRGVGSPSPPLPTRPAPTDNIASQYCSFFTHRMGWAGKAEKTAIEFFVLGQKPCEPCENDYSFKLTPALLFVGGLSGLLFGVGPPIDNPCETGISVLKSSRRWLLLLLWVADPRGQAGRSSRRLFAPPVLAEVDRGNAQREE